MEQCEHYNRQDELISLHFNELSEYCRVQALAEEKRRPRPDSGVIWRNKQLNQPSESAQVQFKAQAGLTSKGSLFTGMEPAEQNMYANGGMDAFNESLNRRDAGKNSKMSLQEFGAYDNAYVGQELAQKQTAQRPKSSEVYRPRQGNGLLFNQQFSYKHNINRDLPDLSSKNELQIFE